MSNACGVRQCGGFEPIRGGDDFYGRIAEAVGEGDITPQDGAASALAHCLDLPVNLDLLRRHGQPLGAGAAR